MTMKIDLRTVFSFFHCEKEQKTKTKSRNISIPIVYSKNSYYWLRQNETRKKEKLSILDIVFISQCSSTLYIHNPHIEMNSQSCELIF